MPQCCVYRSRWAATEIFLKICMKSVRFWEEINANIWPAIDYLHFDGWLLRVTRGYSRNSNSVWPLYGGNVPIEEKILFCEQRYSDRGMSCGFRLSDIPGHADIEKKLIELGYGSANPNLVMIQSSIKTQHGNITELALDEWIETIYSIHPVDDLKMKEWERQFLKRIILPSRYAIVMNQGKACGYGRSVMQGKIINIENLWVHPDQRKQGAGTRLVYGLL